MHSIYVILTLFPKVRTEFSQKHYNIMATLISCLPKFHISHDIYPLYKYYIHLRKTHIQARTQARTHTYTRTHTHTYAHTQAYVFIYIIMYVIYLKSKKAFGP